MSQELFRSFDTALSLPKFQKTHFLCKISCYEEEHFRIFLASLDGKLRLLRVAKARCMVLHILRSLLEMCKANELGSLDYMSFHEHGPTTPQLVDVRYQAPVPTTA